MVDVDTTNYHFNNRYSYFANASIEMIKAASAIQFERTRGNQKRKRSVFFSFASTSLYARYSFNAIWPGASNVGFPVLGFVPM